MINRKVHLPNFTKDKELMTALAQGVREHQNEIDRIEAELPDKIINLTWTEKNITDLQKVKSSLEQEIRSGKAEADRLRKKVADKTQIFRNFARLHGLLHKEKA